MHGIKYNSRSIIVELSDLVYAHFNQDLYGTMVSSNAIYRCIAHLHVLLPGNCSKMEIMKLRSTKTAPPKINSREDPNLQFRASRNQDSTTTTISPNQLQNES